MNQELPIKVLYCSHANASSTAICGAQSAAKSCVEAGTSCICSRHWGGAESTAVALRGAREQPPACAAVAWCAESWVRVSRRRRRSS